MAHRPRHPRRCGGGSRGAGLGPRRWARLRVPIGSAAHHVPGRSPSACSGRSLRRPPHAPLGRRSGHCPCTAALDAPQGASARNGRLLVCSCAQGCPLRGATRPCAPCAHSRLFCRGQVRQRSRGPITGLGRVALAAGSRPFAAPARLPRAGATRRASSPPGCWALRRPAYLSALTRTAPPAGGLAMRPSPPAARHGRGE